MSEKWVYMDHPELQGGPKLVAMSAFVKLHQKKGFVLVDMVASDKEEEPKTYTRSEVDAMKKKKAPAKKAK